jgi:hypothetical protein
MHSCTSYGSRSRTKSWLNAGSSPHHKALMQLSKEKIGRQNSLVCRQLHLCQSLGTDDALSKFELYHLEEAYCYFRSAGRVDYQLIKCLIFTLPWHSGLKRPRTILQTLGKIKLLPLL